MANSSELKKFKYPGIPQAMDGTGAAVEMETAGSEAGGVYPITPASNMGEGFSEAAAAGKPNVFGRRLIFFEPEGEHAAAAVTAGMSLTGMRSANFSAGQGIAYMHESLYAAVGKRLTYVLNIACRAMTKQALNIHCGHDDYHSVDDTGFFQLFAKNVQEVADINLITHRVAELTLNPGICAQDGFLTSHVIESLNLPEPAMVAEYLGDPADMIECPTPAQKMLFGEKRRRIPELFDVDFPSMLGVVQNQDSYAQGVAAQRPFFFDHIKEMTDIAFAEFYELTGRKYSRASGYRTEDADYVVVGQGSIVWNLEEVCDHLRKEGIKIGVVNVTMFRPFPNDLLASLLKGKKGALVLERVDQPLASDAPLLREIRGSVSKALENGRAKNGSLPYPDICSYNHDEAPDFYSGCFGLGSRDIQPGDMIASIKNMLPGGKDRRLFYMGIDFFRKGMNDSLTEHQKQTLQAYPHIEDLALEPEQNVNLLPKSSISVRIHSIGGWGAITTGKNLALTLSDLLGMNVKANPKYGSEKKGQPTTFYATFAHEPIRLNCDLRFVDVVLSPDPNVFKHSNPLAGLSDGGVFIIQTDHTGEELWRSFPSWAKEFIREKKIKVVYLDAFGIARTEASDTGLQYRMQGAAFQGAFFAASPLMERENLGEKELFDAIYSQLEKKFGHKGASVVEDNVRVISRGYKEIQYLDYAQLSDEKEALVELDATKTEKPALTKAEFAVGDPERFYDQVFDLYQTGQEPLADPFAALSAIPAATGTFRDMTGIRFEVPKFVAENCTGCGHCWTQCPDAAIPGLVTEIDEFLKSAVREAANGQPLSEFPALIEPMAKETRALLKAVPSSSFATILEMAYRNVVKDMSADTAKREAIDAEFKKVYGVVDAFPVAKTMPFFDVPEKKEDGSGGLLSITINPYACKGCNLCVEVCPDNALVAVKQDEKVVDELRQGWRFWEQLPDTPDRFVQVRDVHEGIGVLHTLLLKKENYRMMVGGDGSCMGCGEKTAVHLIVSAIEASLQPHVADFVGKVDSLVKKLDSKARLLLAQDVDLDGVSQAGQVDIPLGESNRKRLEHLTKMLRQLKDLSWRYKSGPGGRGRSFLGMTNSTGCSSVWGSTYPYNPYPFPWANHLFQDAPSLAIGIFEGHMRKMADNFALVRKAELEVEDAYDSKVHDDFFVAFNYEKFTDEEFLLCPPIVAMGGDGAMYDIGFQNLSRLLASGKPLRVVVLDTQVYSNTGGQACTSGFTGQVSDMAMYGKAQHGKTEARKELSLIAMAHRTAYVLQSSQASPAHLIGGILRGLKSRRPAIFNVYTPCQTEHGIPDDASEHNSKLALESRAVPYMVYDPDAGGTLNERLDLDGNPALDADWPTYELTYKDENGKEQAMTLPMTIADWAATEARFGKHFKRINPAKLPGELVLYADYLKLSVEDREGKKPFIYYLTGDKQLGRLSVSEEIVQLGVERLDFWAELRQMSGDKIADDVRDEIAAEKEEEFEARLAEIKAQYDAQIEAMKQSYPQDVARRMAEALMNQGTSIDSFVTTIAAPPAPAVPTPQPSNGPQVAVVAKAAPVAVEEPEVEEEEDLGLGPWIDADTCTACDDCMAVNPKLFVYNEAGKATISDPKKGTFKDLVVAAERCPSGSIHPGSPLNPKEKDLAKWVERATPFNE
ncbi:MAG: 2-oxoacid:acceptor oxidoreductase family protein [Acidobacteriota bacterium]|nr:MAG: 2-oxoacid:acceptor oxidoreductase family protein [Acidobacteriota bacterium]